LTNESGVAENANCGAAMRESTTTTSPTIASKVVRDPSWLVQKSFNGAILCYFELVEEVLNKTDYLEKELFKKGL
jgi:hypothetical protein